MCVCVGGVIWVIFLLKPILLVGFSSPGLTTSCKSIFFHPFSPPLPATGIFPQRSQSKVGGAGAAHHFSGMSVLGSDGERTDRQKRGTERMQTLLLESKAKMKRCVKERSNSYTRNLLGSYRPCSSQSPSEIAFQQLFSIFFPCWRSYSSALRCIREPMNQLLPLNL